MKISGFTIIRNAVLMDYPIVESIRSALPVVDEMIVAVGKSDDDTKALIQQMNDPKIRIVDTIWDTSRTQGGLVLSEKTNEALLHCNNDWCLYLQGDEVLHEDDYPLITKAITEAERKGNIQGVLFNYVHFYGSYHLRATSRQWYRREIRVIKKSTGIQSVGDAQGFRVNGEKANAIDSGARVFHYGWVKPPENMRRKKKLLDRWWHAEALDKKNETFEYERFWGLVKYKGTHPKVMTERIAKQNWSFDSQMRMQDWDLKNLNYLASDLFEKVFRFRIGEYKNYRLK